MARSDHSRSSADDRRASSQPALTLSTGRLEGRPSSTDAASSTRHNPLRDQYPSRRDDPRQSRTSGGTSPHRTRTAPESPYGERRAHRNSAPARAASGVSPRTGRATRTSQSDERDPRTSSARAKKPPRRTGPGRKRASHRPPADRRTIALGVVAVALVVVFVMAIAHLGPFSRPVQQDASKHVGAQSLIAVCNNGSSIGQNVATQVSLATPVEPELDKLTAHAPTREDIEGLSDQKAPFAFALASNQDEPAPVLSDRSLVNLSNALAYYDANECEASYLLMDMTTGRGIAGNLDARIYGASSFKGPFCAYVTQRALPNDIDSASSWRIEQIENTIIYSDNTSYAQMRNDFGNEGIKEWLEEAGVDTDIADDTMFPNYTGRQSALMWLKIYDYLETAGTSAAQWLSDTFAQTEVSFLRNGALGTTSAGQTDYLPDGTEESLEDFLAGDDEDESADGDADGDGESAGGDATGGGDADGDSTSDDARTQYAISLAESDSDDTEGVEYVVETSDSEDGESDDADDEEPQVASLGESVTVRNKAGWIAGQDDNAICDSGIVTINDHDYLMIIMTSARDSAEGEQAFAHLARTLFEIRRDLV